MKKSKKMMALWLTAALAAGTLVGCGGSSDQGSAAPTTAAPAADAGADTTAAADNEAPAPEASGDGAVYYLNFKPEQADQWVALAEAYTKETGVPVTVVTAASGTYEQTLKSEMAKSEAPTLFQVNGPVGLASWKDYCYDLKDTAVYKDLSSDDFALIGDDGSVKGIA